MTKLSYTINETKQATGLSRSAIYRLIGVGKFKPKKFGKRTLIMGENIERVLRELPEAEA